VVSRQLGFTVEAVVARALAVIEGRAERG